MRKKILLSFVVVAFAATMVFSASLGITGSNAMSTITLGNIEKLTRSECEDCTGQRGTCWELSGWQCKYTGNVNDACTCMW